MKVGLGPSLVKSGPAVKVLAKSVGTNEFPKSNRYDTTCLNGKTCYRGSATLDRGEFMTDSRFSFNPQPEAQVVCRS